jgi:hypothetical protein
MISRRNASIIIFLIICLVLGGLIGFYFYTKNKNPGSTILGSNGPRTNFGGYNPNFNNNNSNQNNGSILPSGQIQEVQIPKLREISDTPTAGGDFIVLPIFEVASDTPVIKNIEPADNPNASSTKSKASVKKTPLKKPKQIGTRVVIRYMERGTGHVYETATSTIINTRISNYTEPKIYEAYFVNNGDNIILRGLIGNSDVISTRLATLSLSTTTDSGDQTLLLKDLPVDISQIAISPSKTRLFSVMNTGIRGIISNTDGGSAVGVFNTQYKEWLASWPQENSILLTTKASSFAPGFSYLLNTQTNGVKRIMGNVYGLTTNPSPDLSTILFNESDTGTFTLNVFNTSDSTRYQLPFKTMAEKCAWAHTEKNVIYCAVPSDIAFGSYPDTWYQGQITFADSIWKYNIATGESREIMDIPNEAGQVIDAINLSVSPTDDYIVFTNKADLTFWGLQLVEPVKNVVINPINLINSTSSSSTISNTSTSTKPKN